MQAIKDQGISTCACARRHGLSRAALYRWQRKVKASAAEAAAVTEANTGDVQISGFLNVGNALFS
ncbi:MAG: transposase [Paucibacter sp.]|nr:transposase [Roseateles sp.]